MSRAPLLPLAADLEPAGRVVTPSAFAGHFVRERAPARGLHHLTGVEGCGGVWLCVQLLQAGAKGVVLICPDTDRAHRAHSDARYLLQRPPRPIGPPRPEPALLLMDEGDPYAPTQPDRQRVMARLGALTRLAQGSIPLLVTSARALVHKVVPRTVLLEARARLRLNEDVDLAVLRRRLSDAGYAQTPVVEDPGCFALRGGIVDVWSSDARVPVRAELLGDAVLSLKEFDPDSQRTLREIDEVVLPPAREAILTNELRQRAERRLRELCDGRDYPSLKTRALIEDVTLGRQSFGITAYLPAFYDLEPLWEYLSGDEIIVFDDPVACKRELQATLAFGQDLDLERYDRPHFPVSAARIDEGALERHAARHPLLALSDHAVMGHAGDTLLDRLDAPSSEPESLGQRDQRELDRAIREARSATGKGGALDPLLQALSTWHDEGLLVECVARTNTQAMRLATLLQHRDIQLSVALTEDEREGASTSPVTVTTGTLERGVVSPGDGRVLLSEVELFGRKAGSLRTPRKRARAPLEDLRALAPGDHVIHSEHGVGRYLGLENRHVAGAGVLELLVVEYGGGKLYLPVYRLNQIEKYAGGDAPKLDRLGGTTFAKTKARAKAQARELADELLRLYAERSAVEKDPLPPPDDDYAAFEAAFPYEETSDQTNAILDVQADLSLARVMDRLVCGDVGFGKTEVALRAAFRVASAGRQVAVLCPTTVLAQQHYLTFRKRLSGTPFEVRVLSRFTSKKSSAETLERLRQGTVDVVVGTHRLLSKDVHFKELGLLVIDEEQHFGVVHKERMKRLRTQVDVLTLTATPIPRTLQLALGGLREVSYISTPPLDRRAIRTVVARFDEDVIREAIERELQRGGQVYYVYNRVEGLHERAQRLQALLPRARIGVGHGQMRETLLEQTMLDFVGGETDVLVSTAIVESGLDIPRANTMIIDRADLMGLAQLYQLRGRVGRSEQRAYCYLLVPSPSEMNDDARNRIEAMERYTALGSGFHIATLDMELRGAGDLLGAEQSGAVATVGLELFCRMLEEATAELRGETYVHEIEPELNFDVEALLPHAYIEEVGLRLSLYKRLASAAHEHEVMELAREMEDRFGAAPREALAFVELMRIKVELRQLRVLVCEGTPAAVSLRFREDTPLDAGRLATFVATQKGSYRLNPDGRLTRRAKDTEQHAGSIGLAQKMLAELSECVAPAPNP